MLLAADKKIAYPTFPDAGGLLAIGGTDSADVISWITVGDPDNWGIFFWNWPGEQAFTFRDLNLTGFLVELASMKSSLFPECMPPSFFSPEKRGVVVTD